MTFILHFLHTWDGDQLLLCVQHNFGLKVNPSCVLELTHQMTPICDDVFGGVFECDWVQAPFCVVDLDVVDDQGVAARVVRLPAEDLLRVRSPESVFSSLTFVFDRSTKKCKSLFEKNELAQSYLMAEFLRN
jgi:hypothetical protein